MTRESRSLAAAVTLALAGFAGPAEALRLGEARVLSRFAEPLVVEIDAHYDAFEAEMAEINARIAPSNVYVDLGLEPIPALVGARARYSSRREKTVIRIEGTQPLRDVWVPLVLEVDVPTGRLRRQYDLLIEMSAEAATPRSQFTGGSLARPGSFAASLRKPEVEDRAAAAATPAAPKRGTATQPATSAPATRATTSTQAPGGVLYRVRRGDSLTLIARRANGNDASGLESYMRRVVAENPHAFRDGNRDLLFAGVELWLPQATVATPAAAPAVTAAPTPGAPPSAPLALDQPITDAQRRVQELTERAQALDAQLNDLQRRREAMEAAPVSRPAHDPAPAPAARASGQDGWIALVTGLLVFAVGVVAFVLGRRSVSTPAQPLVAPAKGWSFPPIRQSSPRPFVAKPATRALDFTNAG